MGKVIGSILARPPNPNRIYSTQTLADLERAAAQIHRDQPDILALAGGDGTLHRAITALLVKRHGQSSTKIPEILLLATGTMNNVAATIGATRFSPVALAERVATKLREGLPFDYAHAYPLRVNDEYGFLYGAGMAVNLLERYYADRSTVGGMRGAVVLAEMFWDELLGLLPRRQPKQLLMKPVRATILLPRGHDARFADRELHNGIMVGSIDQVGLNCRALPDAMRVPGHFMVRSAQMTFWQVLNNIGRIWVGWSVPDLVLDATARTTIIEYATPTITQIDGELRPPTMRDVITCGPMLKFIIG